MIKLLIIAGCLLLIGGRSPGVDRDQEPEHQGPGTKSPDEMAFDGNIDQLENKEVKKAVITRELH